MTIDIKKKYSTKNGYKVILMPVMGDLESENYPIYGAYYDPEDKAWVQDKWTLEGEWSLEDTPFKQENLNLVKIPGDSHTPATDDTRGGILDEARRIISGDRDDQYGEPEDSFQRIADYWNAYLKHHRDLGWGGELLAEDVALMMVLLKLARLEAAPAHRDSWVDGAGYFACGAEIALRPKE